MMAIMASVVEETSISSTRPLTTPPLALMTAGLLSDRGGEMLVSTVVVVVGPVSIIGAPCRGDRGDECHITALRHPHQCHRYASTPSPGRAGNYLVDKPDV